MTAGGLMVDTSLASQADRCTDICLQNVHPIDFDLINQAARMQQLPVADFVLLAALRAARDAVNELEAYPLKQLACAGSQTCTAPQDGCSLALGCTDAGNQHWRGGSPVASASVG